MAYDSFWCPEAAVTLHRDPEQLERQRRAQGVRLNPRMVDHESQTAAISGYAVSLNACTCMDAAIRRLPCKHMYRLASYLKVFPRGEGMSIMEKTNVRRFFEGFCWAVPVAFVDAVAVCHFGQGDVLYDTELAYVGPWSEARNHIRYSVQVKYPSRGRSESIAVSEAAFKTNWHSPIEFEITDYALGSTTTVRTTQGRLYSLLRTGEIAILNEQIPNPMPTLHAELFRAMKREGEPARIAGALRSLVARPLGGCVFAMPYDPCYALLREKHLVVKYALEAEAPTSVHVVSPEQLGVSLDNYCAPTLRVAAFLVSCNDPLRINAVLKEGLYKPESALPAEKQRFDVTRHGILYPDGRELGKAGSVQIGA